MKAFYKKFGKENKKAEYYLKSLIFFINLLRNRLGSSSNEKKNSPARVNIRK